MKRLEGRGRPGRLSAAFRTSVGWRGAGAADAVVLPNLIGDARGAFNRGARIQVARVRGGAAHAAGGSASGKAEA